MRTLSVIAAVLVGCGGAELEIASEAEEMPDEALWSTESTVIVGSVNWSSTTLLTAGSPEATNARAVGYISIPKRGSRCTAWLIGRDRVITNNHCVPSAADAVGARVAFNYVDGVSSTSRAWYDCSGFVATWTDVDATVLKCTARNGVLPGDAQGWVTLATADASVGSSLYVIHQNCDYYTSPGCSPTKKYSPGVVKSASWWSKDITYDADTLGGSSGSAVFAKSGTQAHRLVALHHLGYGADSQGRGTKNGGVKVLSLKARLAQVGM